MPEPRPSPQTDHAGATRFYLIRHGQTDWNAERRYQGQIDSRLSEVGRAQAAQLAHVLARIPLRAVYSSPLSRALRTAEAIAGPHDLRVVTMELLGEVRLGDWEGLTVAEIVSRFGPIYEARRRDPERVTPRGGETLAELGARAMHAVRQIVARHPGGTVAAVAHGGVNKTILLSVLGAPFGSYWRIRQDNAAINVLEFGGGRARVTLLNETSHLGGLEIAT